MAIIDTVLERISQMKTLEDIEHVRSLILPLENSSVSHDVPSLWKAYDARRDELAKDADVLLSDVTDILRINGVEYPLTEWLTLTQYTKRFGIKNVETIMNWVRRGIVPADHVKEIPQLGIKLIKAVVYEPRPYNKGE